MTRSRAAVQPRAVVFDLDGTLADNMGFHERAFDQFAAAHGLPPITREIRRRLDGQRNRDIFPILFGRSLSETELFDFGNEKEAYYRRLSAGGLRPLPGLTDFLDLLAARSIPVALATSAPARNVLHTLAGIGLAGRFPVVKRSDEVARGKPHPDVFLAAAAALDVPPADCVAFEDALLGIQAAKAAHMWCVALTTTFAPAVFEAQGLADEVTADFASYLMKASWVVSQKDVQVRPR